MISINTLKIDEFAEKIIVDISASPGNKIVKVLLWNNNTFKDYTKALDLSELLESSDETESFSIFAQFYASTSEACRTPSEGWPPVISPRLHFSWETPLKYFPQNWL